VTALARQAAELLLSQVPGEGGAFREASPRVPLSGADLLGCGGADLGGGRELAVRRKLGGPCNCLAV